MSLHKSAIFAPAFSVATVVFWLRLPLPSLPPPAPAFDTAFQAVLAPHPGSGVAGHFRVLLGGHAEMIVRRGLDIFGLGPLDSLCRMLPDFLLHEPLAMPQAGLAHQLGAVGPSIPTFSCSFS